MLLNDESFYIDSGFQRHICGDRDRADHRRHRILLTRKTEKWGYRIVPFFFFFGTLNCSVSAANPRLVRLGIFAKAVAPALVMRGWGKLKIS